MVVSKNRLTNFFINAYFILFYLSCIFIDVYNLFSKFFLIIGLPIFIFVYLINYDVKSFDKSNNNIIILAILFSIISMFFSLGSIGSILNLMLFLIIVSLFKGLKVSKGTILLNKISIFLIFFVNMYRSTHVYSEFLVRQSTYNPNTVAELLLLSITIIDYILTKKGKMKLALIFIFFAIFGIYYTQSRGSLIAILLYFIFTRVKFLRNFIYNHKKKFLVILIICGLAFTFLYVHLYVNNINFKLPFMTKPLYTGREKLWYYMIQSMKNQTGGFLFGLGTRFNTEIGIIGNAHNWYLGILYTFGIITFSLYYYFLFKNIVNLKNKKIFFAFLCIFFGGFFEVMALFFIVQIFIGLLYLFDNNSVGGKLDD